MRRPRHRRPPAMWTVAIAVALVAVGGGVALQVRRSGLPRLSPPTATPAPTSPSPAPAVPSSTPASPLPDLGAGLSTDAVLPSGAAVAAAVNPVFADPRLGPRVSAVVADALTGAVLYSRNAGLPVVPASTQKLLTAVAALHVLGPDRRLETSVVPVGARAGGRLDGRLLLVGGGDTTLASPASAPRNRYPVPARLATLADAVRAAGITEITGAVAVDSGAFAPPRVGPGWKPGYLTEGSVAVVTALMVDGGRITPGEPDRHADPDLAAGRLLRDLLRERGVRVPDVVVRARAPQGVAPIATTASPTVAALVERMLAASDNNLAESLAHLVARERGLPATFDGGAQATASALAELGLPADAGTVVRDGSGLSPLNRVTTGTLARVVALALDPARPRLRPLLSGLPVSAFDGTLASRFTAGPARAAAGRVRAKTGSLNNVSTLSGVVETVDGRLLVFAFSADRLPSRVASRGAQVLDSAAAALARCGCPAAA